MSVSKKNRSKLSSAFFCVYHDFFYETDVNNQVKTDYRKKILIWPKNETRVTNIMIR